MALPNHPDVAYEFVKTLRECGYQWVLVQEHTVERPETAMAPSASICRTGWSAATQRARPPSIIAIIKTQGSDTKLVAQMQPYYEAKGLSRWELAGRSVPPLVTQIADGENGGVMMNEFPSEVHGGRAGMLRLRHSAHERHRVPGAPLRHRASRKSDLPVLQPIFQKRIWDRFRAGEGPEKLPPVIEALHKEDSRFHVEGGSWTNNISWVRGYDALLGPMERVSSLFYEKVLKPGVPSDEHRYRNALFHLLASQTSCYRYWGQGLLVDYGREICRRATEILNHDF